MTRRRLLPALAVALAVLVPPGFTWWLAPRRPYIDQTHCDRIEPGMRLDEVEALLGGPPGDYTDQYVPFAHILGPGHPEQSVECWSSDHGQICVELNERGAVVEAWFEEFVAFRRPSWAERLSDWLRSYLP